MANLTAVLNQLQRERTRLSAKLDRLNGAISALSMRLNAAGEIDGEFLFPPARRCA